MNFTSGGTHRGRMIIPNPVEKASPSVVKKAKKISGGRGAQIFNLLPETVRTLNTDHVDLFKNHLDVNDPTMTGLGRADDSNSLLYQLPLYYNQNRYLYLTLKVASKE